MRRFSKKNPHQISKTIKYYLARFYHDKLLLSDSAIPEPPTDFDGVVNMHKFWEGTERMILSKGLTGETGTLYSCFVLTTQKSFVRGCYTCIIPVCLNLILTIAYVVLSFNNNEKRSSSNSC